MKNYLCIDIGASNIRLAIIDSSNNIVAKIKQKINNNDEIVAKIISMYKLFNKEYKINKICVGVPGTIIPSNNIIRDLPNLGIKEYNLKGELERFFNCEIIIDNDASLAAIAEFNLFSNVKVFQYITISSGLGGGLIYNGNLFKGSSGYEQEIGRMIIDGGKTLEELCSGNSLKKLLIENGISINYPSDALISNDQKTKQLISEWLNYLAIGISNIVKIINPQIIVIGGGVGNYLDYFKKELLKEMKKYLPKDILQDLTIIKSQLGDDNVLIGASHRCYQDY